VDVRYRGIWDEVRAWPAWVRVPAVGAAAGASFGVFASVGYYLVGQYRGRPWEIAIIAALWGAAVVAPLHNRYGRAAIAYATLLAATLWLSFSVYTGQLTAEHMATELFYTILYVTTLPLLSVGTSTVYTLMERAMRGH
jgi:hypothetical protein